MSRLTRSTRSRMQPGSPWLAQQKGKPFQRIIIYSNGLCKAVSFRSSFSQYQSASPMRVSSRCSGISVMMRSISRSHRAISSCVELPDVMPVYEIESHATALHSSCWLQVYALSMVHGQDTPGFQQHPNTRGVFPSSARSLIASASDEEACTPSVSRNAPGCDPPALPTLRESDPDSLPAPNYNLESALRQDWLFILLPCHFYQ